MVIGINNQFIGTLHQITMRHLQPKYMSRRGWRQLNGEFRYLTPVGEGKLAANI